MAKTLQSREKGFGSPGRTSSGRDVSYNISGACHRRDKVVVEDWLSEIRGIMLEKMGGYLRRIKVGAVGT